MAPYTKVSWPTCSGRPARRSTTWPPWRVTCRCCGAGSTPETAARDSVICTRNGGYALDTERVRTDVARFDELVDAAVGRAPVRALPPLTAAVRLAERPLLEGEARPRWAAEVRERYRIRLVQALLCAGEHALAAREPRTAQELAVRAVALEPFAERGWYVSMAALGGG